jgi:hypothetical protein
VTKVKQGRAAARRTSVAERAKAGLAPRALKARGAKSAKGSAKSASVPRKAGKSKRAGKAKPARGSAKHATVDHPRTVRVRELDPQAKCGQGTSVERLYRVDESVNGTNVAHLVFFDRHGLYCEHGRQCPAVDDVRRTHRNLDWTR